MRLVSAVSSGAVATVGAPVNRAGGKPRVPPNEGSRYPTGRGEHRDSGLRPSHHLLVDTLGLVFEVVVVHSARCRTTPRRAEPHQHRRAERAARTVRRLVDEVQRVARNTEQHHLESSIVCSPYDQHVARVLAGGAAAPNAMLVLLDPARARDHVYAC